MLSSRWKKFKRSIGNGNTAARRIAIIVTIVLLAIMAVLMYHSEQNRKEEQELLLQKNEEHWDERVRIKNEKKERLARYTIYDKLQKEENIRVLILGDEIAAQRGKEYSNTGWWDLLESAWKREYKAKLNRNDHTAYGTNVFQWLYAYQQMDEKEKKFDIAFVSLGYNDEQEFTIDQFSQCYETLIRQMRTENPRGEIVLMIANCMKEEAFTNAIRDLSEYYNLVCLDMIEGFEKCELNVEELTNDGFYPNNDGHREYYNCIQELLKDNIKDDKEISDKLPKARLNMGSGQFEKLTLIPLAELKKVSDTTYKYETDADVVGVSYMTEVDYGENLLHT